MPCTEDQAGRAPWLHVPFLELVSPRRTHGYSRGTRGVLTGTHGVLMGTHGVLTGTHTQVLEQYYASLQRLGAQLDAALLKRREAERLLAAEANARESVCV